MTHRVDANHRDVVAALRGCGWSVQDLAAVGRGCPDLLVGARGVNVLLEVKTAKGQLEPSQVEWHALWRAPVFVVRTADEAIEAVEAVTRVWAS